MHFMGSYVCYRMVLSEWKRSVETRVGLICHYNHWTFLSSYRHAVL